MAWTDALQIAAIVVLAGLGAALVAVGAYGSGAALLIAAAVWFWRLYRTGI